MPRPHRDGGLLRCGAQHVGDFLLALGIVAHLVPHSIVGWREVGQLAVRTFLCGCTAGALFGTALVASESRQTRATLFVQRVVMWGGVAGAAIPAMLLALLGAAGIVLPSALVPGVLMGGGLAYVALGGTMGMLSRRLARRAERPALGSGASEHCVYAPAHAAHFRSATRAVSASHSGQLPLISKKSS